MKQRILGAGLLVCLAPGCATPPAPAASPPAAVLDEALVRQIVEEQSRELEPSAAVLNGLERLLPSWQSAQRRGASAPLERELVRKVVVNFEAVAAAVRAGPHERRVVAAWALGFARVPPNDLGLASPHGVAREILVPLLDEPSDDLLRNALLGLWLLADPLTPLRPLAELVIGHHDGTVRANACLALGAVVDTSTAPGATEALLVALADVDPTVRLHAADIARRFPHPALTPLIQARIAVEDTPLVVAALAQALGTAGARDSAPLLSRLLESPREIIAASARRALVDLYGQDRGPLRADWMPLIESR